MPVRRNLFAGRGTYACYTCVAILAGLLGSFDRAAVAAPAELADVEANSSSATPPNYLWELTSAAAEDTRIQPLAGPLPAALSSGALQFASEAPHALSLTATGDQPPHLVVSPTLRDLTLPTASITVAAWVRIDKPLPWGGIVGALQDNGDYEKGWLLGYRDQQFFFALNSQGSSKLTYLTATRQFDPGFWYFVVGTYDGQRQQLYVDGERVAQAQEQSGAIAMPEDGTFVIGAYRDDDELYGLTGQIERVGIWDRALQDAEIRSEFNSRKARFPEIEAVRPLVEDWPTWQRDSQRTGIATEPLQLPLVRKWSYKPRHAPAPAWPPPARQDIWNRKYNLSPRVVFDRSFAVVTLGDAVVFASSADDRVSCLDADTGQLRWTYFTEAPVRLAPTLESNRVLFGCDDGRVYCLDLQDGTLVWQFEAFDVDRRMPGNGRMISHRPVRTGIIVEDGVAWFCSGLFPNQGVEQFAVAVEDGRLLARGPLDVSPQGYLERRGGRLFIPTGRDPAGAFSSALQRRGKGVGKEVREIADRYRHAFIGAGDVRIGGGEGIVAALSADDGKELWSAAVEGTAWALATARGRLYVSTDTGRIECFAPASDGGDVDVVIDEKLVATADSSPPNPDVDPERVARWVQQSGTRQGWCLAFTADADWLAELARQSQWKIVAVTADRAAADRARRALNLQGLYGGRIAVHVLSDAPTLPYSDYLFNVVLGPNCFASDRSLQIAEAELHRVVRPAGGVAWWDRTEAPALRREPLAGAGQWTHLYADPANTICSGDTHDYSRLQIQWFGEPGPRDMIDRHHRTSAPLFASGRLFVPGDDRVYALDAYNGTVLWERETPHSRRIAVFRDASQLAASDDHLFVASADHCLMLDAQSGYVHRTLEIPGQAGNELHWGYLAHLADVDLVVGSAAAPTASRREISRDVAGKESYWDDVPLVGSNQLFVIDPNTGEPKWVYQAAQGLIVNPSIAISEGRIWFIESDNPETLSSVSGRATARQLVGSGCWLTAIDVSDGKQLVRRALDLSNLRHNIYLSAAAGKIIVAGSYNSGENKKTDQVLYDIMVLDAHDGSPVWNTTQRQGTTISGDHGEQDHRPVIIADRLYCEPFGYQLHTGEPLTDFQWNTSHRRGCGNLSASTSAFFFRQNVTSMFDLRTNQTAPVTQITRPGCWINILPAGGLLMIPEASSGCTCNYPIQTSITFLPAPPQP